MFFSKLHWEHWQVLNKAFAFQWQSQAQKGSKTIPAPIWDMDTFCFPDQIGSTTRCASSLLLFTLSWCEVGEELFTLAKAGRRKQMREIQICHILK